MPAEIVDLLKVSDPEAAMRRAVGLLDDGKLVILPTETVYGIAGRLDHAESVESLRRFRDASGSTSPFTPHVESMDDALTFLGRPSGMALRLMRKLWPGPVALSFDLTSEERAGALSLTKLSAAELFNQTTLTLRCPDNLATGAVLGMTQGPVGMVRLPGDQVGKPDLAAVANQLGDEIALVLDMGPTKFSKPSTMIKVEGDAYRISRAGVFDDRIIERQLKSMILFVCSGNTCRSPMAAAVARKLIADKLGVAESALESRGVIVQSAGTFAVPGMRATPQAVEAASQMGGDLSTHRSKPVSLELLNQADHVFAMGRSHEHQVVAISPEAQSRVEPMDPEGDVEDPIGGSVSLYTELATKFRQLLEPRLERFLKEQGISPA